MKTLAACLPSSESKPTFAAASSETAAAPTKPKPSALLADYLWLHMGATYPHKWTSAQGEDPRGTAGKVWAVELAGMTRGQIDAGLSACRNSADPWPPSLPQFKAACFGIPPLAAVRLDHAKADAFTRQVWQYLDGHRYRQAPADQADRLLREAYELAREYVMRGGELPAVVAEIAHDKPEPKPADPERAQAAIDRIKRELSGRDRAAGPDA